VLGPQQRTGRPLVAVRLMATAQTKYHILDYKYVSDILEKRGPHREGHLDAARAQAQAGKLLIAGAAGDPVDGGLFVFQNTTKEDIEAFVKADPYVKADLVSSWDIRPFNAVVGSVLSPS